MNYELNSISVFQQKFLGKVHIVDVANGFDVIDGNRDAIAGGLAQAHGAVDDRVEHDVAAMETYILIDSIG